MRNDFSVYEHWRMDTNEPFYVGKGKGTRPLTVDRKHNKIHQHILNKLERTGSGILILIVASKLSDEDACSLERELIQKYGRKDLRTGSLCNLTDGGDGASGYKHSEDHKHKISSLLKGRSLGPEWREKISKSLIGRRPTTERKEKQRIGYQKYLDNLDVHPNKGKTAWNKGKKGVQVAWNKGKRYYTGHKHTEETKEKIRLSSIGRRHLDESKAKISTARLGKSLSVETRQKISEGLKCTISSLDKHWNKGRQAWNKDKKTGPMSLEARKKMSISRIGNIPWNKGKKGIYKHSEETKRKITGRPKRRTYIRLQEQAA